MLSSPKQVVWALITYTDWWQPNTASVYQVGNRRETFASDGIRAGLLDTLSERDELCRRMQQVAERDRVLLFLLVPAPAPGARDRARAADQPAPMLPPPRRGDQEASSSSGDPSLAGAPA